MRLLALISWPYLRKHAVRSLLTVVGIVLGVAVFVAMHTANQAVFFDLPYRFPVGIALMLLPTILFAALFSALWPAESAVRTSLVEALEYE